MGEHTEEILRELGYDDARIGALRAAEVVGALRQPTSSNEKPS
jgi:hypothetical protein